MMDEASKPATGEDTEQERLRNEYWSDQAKKGWGPGGPDQFVTDFFREHAQDLGMPGERPVVVDIGCGTGDHVIFFAQNGCDVVGIEPALGMRERAMQALEAADQQAKIIDGQSSALPLSDNSVDLVISFGVSHHGKWENAQRDIAEVARVLKSGGFLLFRVRSINDSLCSREQVEDVGYTARDLFGVKKGIVHHYFTAEELLRLGKVAGLEVVGEPIERVQNHDSRQRARWRVAYRKKT